LLVDDWFDLFLGRYFSNSRKHRNFSQIGKIKDFSRVGMNFKHHHSDAISPVLTRSASSQYDTVIYDRPFRSTRCYVPIRNQQL